ncbi:MAG: signal peptidase I [Pseudomonadales bacterium]|nr:signal peptidase I [Pseudomonadales bacterium]
MSFDFPLFLVVSTGLTGLIWLADTLFLKPARVKAADSVRATVDENSEAGQDAVAKALKEPLMVEYSASFFPVLAIVLVLRSFLAEPFQIPTGSMIPTLQIGDFIVVNKFAYGVRLPVLNTLVMEVEEPRSGEVMVFIPPHVNEYYIKRVIGTPGDRIRYEDKTLYINGIEQPQKFIAQMPGYTVLEETTNGVPHLIHKRAGRDEPPREWVVPEGMYFMMGDNRDNSYDSRGWGYVPEENIVGKAFAVWFHWGDGLPTFSRNGWIE